MYGVNKVAGELLCQYYFKRFGVDTRSVRFPGLISHVKEPGGGTDDSKGYFVEPTIISGLKSKDRIMQEEIFGPVVGFVKVN
ncbi:aldehyde dehydrogenase family protein, partial [Staphylococcus aureus]|nr:aldehyde dehydrogenase family protein [Staphylococcus aureus]